MEKSTNTPRLIGHSTINHTLRVKLGLNCSEYVMADCIYNLIEKKKDIFISTIYNYTGFSGAEQKAYVSALIAKGIIFPIPENSKTITFTSKWLGEFETLEKEFDDFWFITVTVKDGKELKKTGWPGSRKSALNLYQKVRKTITKDYLIQQRDYYFKLLKVTQALGFDRSKMMATVFLGPQERYNENWKDQLEEKMIKYREMQKREGIERVVTPSKMTSNDKKDLYAEDSK
jgi:hypothetical protein